MTGGESFMINTFGPHWATYLILLLVTFWAMFWKRTPKSKLTEAEEEEYEFLHECMERRRLTDEESDRLFELHEKRGEA